MMKRFLFAAALSLLAAGAVSVQTVILVRHAEKVDNSNDPALSGEGEARATALAVALSAADLTHIFVTPLQRTRLTADLTARSHAITPEVVSFDGGTDAHVRRIDQRIRNLPATAVVLVVGHSNTIPLIADAAGEIGPAAMADCEYDRMTIISVRDSIDSHAIIARYGAPSDC
jgi:broad specificity phosphatase PhoE